jgi:peptidoglycan/xylan/chitin deacetylase (PgdA/CDA1 family)
VRSVDPMRSCKHVVTLAFDDGFDRSSRKTADIFERFGLSASINVVARGHVGEPIDVWHGRWQRGDFGLWNDLQARGHEIMPHGYEHANKAELPFAKSKRLIEACLEVFTDELDAFDVARAVFAFPYNASTPELEAWLPEVVRAFRTRGDPIMPLPRPRQRKVTCTSFGPGPCDEHLENVVWELLSRPSGWLCYNLHGLDGEGWGPLSAATLERLLDRLVERSDTRVLPVGAALDLARNGGGAG